MTFGYKHCRTTDFFARNAEFATKQDLKYLLSPGVEEGKKNRYSSYTGLAAE